MEVTEIPFVKHIGITEEESQLTLAPALEVTNHIGTIHASAQFTLAETASGLFLQEEFADIEGKVLPLLRSSTVKYKSPATTKLKAVARVDDELKTKFKEQFLKRGRASIAVDVELLDSNELVTMAGEFVWFVQKVNINN
jgi:acyl-coenzyme A thioesterase PaaI-like protein